MTNDNIDNNGQQYHLCRDQMCCCQLLRPPNDENAARGPGGID